MDERDYGASRVEYFCDWRLRKIFKSSGLFNFFCQLLNDLKIVFYSYGSKRV